MTQQKGSSIIDLPLSLVRGYYYVTCWLFWIYRGKLRKWSRNLNKHKPPQLSPNCKKYYLIKFYQI